HLARWTEARRANAARYRALFKDAGLADRLVLPIEPPGRRHIYNQFVGRTANRDDLRRDLAAPGVGTEVYYPVPFPLQPCFADARSGPGGCPQSDRAAAESVALPIFGELTSAEQAAVVSAVAMFMQPSAASAADGAGRL